MLGLPLIMGLDAHAKKCMAVVFKTTQLLNTEAHNPADGTLEPMVDLFWQGIGQHLKYQHNMEVLGAYDPHEKFHLCKKAAMNKYKHVLAV